MNAFVKKILSVIVYCLAFYALTFSLLSHATPSEKTIATINTSMGDIKLELFKNKAPSTVANFIAYAKSGFFNGTIFHRVIPNFMIQAGGFDSSLAKKTTKNPITNEANPFVPNRRGTIAMARTSAPNSATSQFFINVVDNSSLNKSSSSAGYAVFGKVLSGMIVADQISSAKTGIQNQMRDVPLDPIIINSVTISYPKPDTTTNTSN
ncbi:MAG: peptidyl-prolyl cis-trans isomerase A (cyclophilin A) [Oleiphilaceae bacterium]|jgi:peptidyl-prolyl cis-trans isomerase A (cyclophilin A)